MVWSISRVIALVCFIVALVLIILSLAGVPVTVIGILVLALIGALALAMLLP